MHDQTINSLIVKRLLAWLMTHGSRGQYVEGRGIPLVEHKNCSTFQNIDLPKFKNFEVTNDQMFFSIFQSFKLSKYQHSDSNFSKNMASSFNTLSVDILIFPNIISPNNDVLFSWICLNILVSPKSSIIVFGSHGHVRQVQKPYK